MFVDQVRALRSERLLLGTQGPVLPFKAFADRDQLIYPLFEPSQLQLGLMRNIIVCHVQIVGRRYQAVNRFAGLRSDLRA